jgi:Mg-chelatase subunit ChlD
MRNRLSWWLLAGVMIAGGAVAGCTAGGGGHLSGGSGATGGAAAGSGGSAGSAGSDVGGFASGSGGATTGSCQHEDIVFKQQTPTVLLLVDRSGSMFDNGSWEPLKTAALAVVKGTQDKVRYGLLTFTGIAPAQCPLTTETDIALNNYDVIQAAYEAASMKPGQKLETPTAMTIHTKAIPMLSNVMDPGGKYIVFVTDGEPDRCDDGIAECARDDVVGAVQDARKQGITTLVFGLGPATYKQHLQDVANAGAGEPVQSPGDTALYACFGGDWKNAKGAYSATGGAAKYYTPDPSDEAALETQLSLAIDGAKSCTFDLQGKIQVDLANASEGKVLIDGVPIPYDDMNGWHMLDATTLTLSGAACEALKKATKGISFDFPCDVIVPQ